MRSRLILSLALTLGGIGAVPSASASASAIHAQRFRVTRVVVPRYVVQNGARKAERIYWSGSPTFPVQVETKTISCPVCQREVVKVPVLQRQDPIIFRNYLFCSGGLTQSYAVIYWLWLVDAHGRQTPRVRVSWTCRVG